LGADFWIGQLYLTSEQISILGGEGAGLDLFRESFKGTYFVAIALTALVFCKLARRTVAGIKWAWVACGVCALHGIFFQVWAAPHNLSLGYSPRPNWAGIGIPLCVALAAWARLRHAASQFAPLPAGDGARPGGRVIAANARLPRLPRPRLVTPTSIAVLLIIAAFISLASIGLAEVRKEHTRAAQLRSNVWPKERAATMARIAARQLTKDTFNETTIDLKPRVNAALTDSLDIKREMNRNNLAELPMGIHIYGGVPFDVEGKIQLFGRGLTNANLRFPARVRNIAIGRKCVSIYLFHGAATAGELHGPVTVARLVLHYANGSQSEIAVNAGEHLLNWRGPIYATEAKGKVPNVTAPGSELAWAGGNAWLRKKRPEDSLRFYRSAFENPHPELEIASVDYVSALTDAAPFLLGMTVE
jgi:hypothetical protein